MQNNAPPRGVFASFTSGNYYNNEGECKNVRQIKPKYYKFKKYEGGSCWGLLY